MIYVLSGGSPLYSVIAVTYPPGSICTCGGKKAKDTSGFALFNVRAGTYTVECHTSDNSQSKSTSVTIAASDKGKSKSVTLNYYALYYDTGEQFNDVTGGWRAQLGSLSTGSDHLTVASSTKYTHAIATTTNKLNMAGIKTLCFEVQFTEYLSTVYSSMGLVTQFQSSSAGSDIGDFSVCQVTGDSLNKKLYSIDVSNLTGSYYPYIRTNWGDSGKTTANIYKVYGIPK